MKMSTLDQRRKSEAHHVHLQPLSLQRSPDSCHDGGGGNKIRKKREEEVDMALMLCLCVIRRKSLKLPRFSFCSVMLRRDASLLLLFFPDALRMRSNCKMFTCKVRSVPRCPLCPTGLRRRVCFVTLDEACLSGFYCLIIYSIAVCKSRCKCKNFQDK